MFLAIEGPPQNNFERTACVKAWSARGRHAATDLVNTNKDKESKVEPGQIEIWREKIKIGVNCEMLCVLFEHVALYFQLAYIM